VLCGGLEPFIKNPTEWGIRNNDPEFQGGLNDNLL
jgi:hypothetical protein